MFTLPIRIRPTTVALALASSFCPGLRAQEAAPAPATPVVQEVVITGSRIPQPNLASTSPIQVVSSTEIRQQGSTDMADLFNRLPQNFQSANVDFSNTSNPLGSAGGLTTADLRGLGPQRTLVLVDGRRLGSADPNTLNPNPAPDLDQIPLALVDRVDVVTGGASAVYGSDAIAGVVNFIMKKNFNGIQLDAQAGINQHSNHNDAMQQLARESGFPYDSSGALDGQSRDFSVLAGTDVADGKENITAYLEYRTAQPVLMRDRDFTACQVISGFPNTCIGTANSNHFGVNGSVYSVVENQLLPYPQPGSSPPPEFNSNQYLYLSRQDRRYNAGFMAHVDVSDAVRPYAEFSFMNDRTTTEVAPSGLFFPAGNVTTASVAGVGGQYLVNCSNPLLSAQERGILCTPAQVAGDTLSPGSTGNSAVVDIGRRNIEGGPRIAYFEHSNYRAVGGISGDLGHGLKYDGYLQYYYTSLFNSNQGYLDYSKVNNALQVTGTAANPVCVNQLAAGCVPYNIWNQGAVTPDQVAYLSSPGTGDGSVTQRIVHFDVTADLSEYGLTSPWAKRGAGINVGYEHRSEFLAWDPDAAELAGTLAGFSGAVVPIHNGYSVSEGFVEARDTVIQDLPFVQELSLDAGYRYSKYTTAGHTNAYKFEVQYAPVDDVRLRASYQRAVRAPNIIELFNPPSYGQQGFLGVDPCAGASPTASFEQCAHTGVTAAQYGTIPQCVSNQCGQITGGNIALKPEVANTYSVGLTYTPSIVPNLTSSVDFFNINLKNEISTFPGAYLFNQCLGTGDPTFCSQVVRNHVTGALTGASVQGGGYIVQTAQNIAQVTFRGIDVQANYKYPLPDPLGTVSVSLNGTALIRSTTTPAPGTHTFDCVGLFGPNCQSTIYPRWRHNMRVTWQTPFKAEVSVQWRFIGKVGLDNNDPDPSLFGSSQGAYDPYNRQLPNVSYLDLSLGYTVWKDVSVRGGINNILDKDPPIIATDYTGGAGSPNTYPTYDLLGRQVFLGFTAKF